ncbi:hypothetical protein RHO14_04270 [Orbus wheelerorum]|uniref:peptidoglycan-binding protein n=1 Tax=Orbus wheelerorum TaxID=3074111 RepID=UPI00370D83A4
MTIKKITNFVFPVGNKELSQDAYYRALSEAKSGFYPIGKNRLWHGGIHIDKNTISELKANCTDHMPEVKCISDGEVIAYRINDSYPSIDYDDKVAFYSSGFVLVRHLLQMDYVELPLSIANNFNVISGSDSMAKGINVRCFPGDKKIGFLSNGAEITVMLDKELILSGYYWYPLASITNSYSSVPKLSTSEIKMPETSTEKTRQCLGWISLGKTKLTSATQTVADQTDDPTKNDALEKGLAIKASQSVTSDTLSLLPIGSKIKLSEFDTNQKWAKVATLSEGTYSSTPTIQGWVEVSNLQQLPVVPEKDKKAHQLYFYSLYVHLADMVHYEHYPKAIVPSYFTKNTYKVTKDALDKVEGLNIRSKPLAGKGNDANILGVLQQGTKVKLHLNFQEKDKTNWYAVASLNDGYRTLPQLSAQNYTLSDGKTSQTILGWICLNSAPDKSGEYTIGNKAKDQSSKSMGLRIRKAPKNGAIVSMLPEGCTVSIKGKIDPKKHSYIKISSDDIEANKATLPLAKGDYFIWSASLELEKEQQLYNQVIVLDEPLPVKAGEVIGHVGHYHFANQAVKKSAITPNIYLPISTIKPYQVEPLLHVELFTCDELPSFIKKTQEEAKKIAEKDKPLLLVDKEAKLYRVSDKAEKLSIPTNVDVEVIDGKGQKWLKVKERYSLTINASNYGYTLNDLDTKKALNVDSKKHSQFITALNLQTTDVLTTKDIPATITFTGNYINPTTKESTTDKAVATKAKSGYTDINVILVRNEKTIWIERSQLNSDGRRRALSGSLSGWKKHPLTDPQTNDNLVVGYPKTIKLSDSSQFSEDEKATDESKNEWRYITVGSNKDVEIKGWVKTTQEHVKLVSPWEWSGFEQIEANHSALAELRLSNIKAENEAKLQSEVNATQVGPVENTVPKKRVKTGSDLLTHLMSILKNLNHDDSDNPLTTENLKSALRKPWLAQQFGHILVKYESEWYAEIDGEGKMPKWEALNDQLTGTMQTYLDFTLQKYEKQAAVEKLKTHAARLSLANSEVDAYLKKANEYLDSISSLIRKSEENIAAKARLNEQQDYLANNIELWEKEKQRIKTLLWWDEVAKKLAEKQAAQPKETEATKASESSTTDTAETEAEPTKIEKQPLPSLSTDGKAWYFHPVGMINRFSLPMFKLGDQNELIREVNIRLAGFGGNVPTDYFDERTEKMIKQFQRDYMKVNETGVIDLNLLKSIDSFQEKYPIDEFFQQAKCRCRKCDGFGSQSHISERQDNKINERLRKYEYPGIHRTLFWVLRAWQFYLSEYDSSELIVTAISSGYRCWFDNNNHSRSSTNHMGKALDLHVTRNGVGGENVTDDSRDVLISYSAAQYRWGATNRISLEPGARAKLKGDRALAPTWVHYDVRSFSLIYLDDRYFAKSVNNINGPSLENLFFKLV